MELQLQAGYFSIKNPLLVIDRWLNPYHHKDSIDIRGKKMAIMYSKCFSANSTVTNRRITTLFYVCSAKTRSFL